MQSYFSKLKHVFAIILILLPIGVHSQSVLNVAFPQLTFQRPLDLQVADDGTNRLFVVEQRGLIYVINNSRTTNLKTVFLDIKALNL